MSERTRWPTGYRAIVWSLAAIAILIGAPARAQWVESGDAGDFPTAAGYQNTVGSGPLSTISGTTNTGSNDRTDAYCIVVSNAATFHATTNFADNPNASATWDTRLFLFQPDGTFVLANDDTPSSATLQSFISDPATFPNTPDGGTFDSPASLVSGQSYILVITGFSNTPEDVTGDDLARITSGNGWKRLYGLNPLSDGTFHHWLNGSTTSGSYTIALVGAEFCVDETLGACCRNDGTCDDGLDETDCTSTGGAFHGAGSTCAGSSCAGACCHADGGCTLEDSADVCAAAGGVFQGINTNCTTAACPQPNDLCADATVLQIGVPFVGVNIGATDDDTPDCTVVSPNQGMWYSVIGTGGTLTATTCMPASDFDTVMQVWCSCGLVDCVGGNDDASGALDAACELTAAPGFNRLSRFSWCSQADQAYFIHVGGFNGALPMGTFELIVTDDGVPCGEPAFCSPPTGACCTEFGCSDGQTEADCLANGGAYAGDEIICATEPCPAPPPNDECADAIIITGNGPTGVNTCLGTLSPENGLVCQPNATNDVWWIYEAPCFGTLTIDASGSLFGPAGDTVLAVYDLCGGTELVCDDNGGEGNHAMLSLPVAQEQQIVIRVAGAAEGECGDVSLSFDCAPLCTTCPGDMTGDLVRRGDDIQQFAGCFLQYYGVAPGAECVCADADGNGSIGDSDISVAVDFLVHGPFQCDPGRCCYSEEGQALCTINADSECAALGGYWMPNIAECDSDPCPIGRCCSADGLICANLSHVECDLLGETWTAGLSCLENPCEVPPPNDQCGSMLEAVEGAHPFDLTNATSIGPAEPACEFQSGGINIEQDTWFVYTATCTGILFVDTCGSEQDDTRIAVYAGSDCNNLGEPLECNDDHGEATEGDTGLVCPGTKEASLSIPTTAGNEYIIRVGSPDGSQGGDDVLNIHCEP